MHGNSRSSIKTLIEIQKKKHVLLEDEASDWLQIRTAAYSLGVKGNKANFVVTNRSFFFPPNINMVTHITLCCSYI